MALPGAADAPESSSAQAAPHRRPRAPLRLLEHAVVVSLGLLVLVVHDVGYLRRASFWNDETWVVITTRFPLSDLRITTSSTPIGWSLLLRLVTPGANQVPRVLPLAFAGASVMVAYWFARGLDWRRTEIGIGAGLLAATGVLLAPAMLARNDLKQYTADAAAALLTLLAVSRLEHAWSRRKLAALSVSVWGGMFFSHTVAFVGVAAFASLCLVQLLRRRWGRLAEGVAAGAVTALLMWVVFRTFDALAAEKHPGLILIWHDYFLPTDQGLRAAGNFIRTRVVQLPPSLGLGPLWLAVPLVIAGLVTLTRVGRPVTVMTIVALWPELLLASALKRYPFLDQRTSTFLFAVTVTVAAIGVAGLCLVVRPRLGGGVAAAVAVLAAAAFALHAHPYLRQHNLPHEPIGPQARAVAARAAPDDVILVSFNSSWGFGYYWPIGHPSRTPALMIQGYIVDYPDQRRIVMARGRDAAGVDAALNQALARAPSRPGARIWLVRIHMIPAERQNWATALAGHGLVSQPIGHDGLEVITLP
jgi:hypothetical protein